MTRDETNIERYLDAVDHELHGCSFRRLHESCNGGDPEYAQTLLKKLHKEFQKIYGKHALDASDCEFVVMPAVFKLANGNKHIGLVELDLSSSGEHWGTTMFTQLGCITQGDEDMTDEQAAYVKTWFPYRYWYTPDVANDIHLDKEDMPEDAYALYYPCEQPQKYQMKM